MNDQRALASAKRRSTRLFDRRRAQCRRQLNDLIPVRFPLYLDMAGYRVCFVSPQAKVAVAKVRTLDELRRFTVAQGVGWLDVHILRANGFQVEEVTSYEAMFKMVAQSLSICSAAAWSRCAARPNPTPTCQT